MREFKTYTKAQFERMLWLAKAELGLNYIKEVSVTVKDIDTNIEVWEYVYAIPTSLPNVRLLVYSSVDKATGKTREYGSDAVRFVLESAVGGKVYRKRMGKRLRIDTLEKNVSESIQKAMAYLHDLQVKRSA